MTPAENRRRINALRAEELAEGKRSNSTNATVGRYTKTPQRERAEANQRIIRAGLA